MQEVVTVVSVSWVSNRFCSGSHYLTATVSLSGSGKAPS